MSFEKINVLVPVCDTCGPEWWDDGTTEQPPTYTNPHTARRELASDFEWRITRQINGRFTMVCGSCAAREDCAAYGHTLNTDAACARCGDEHPSSTLPAGHPESMTAELGDADEEFLAALDAELCAEDAQ